MKKMLPFAILALLAVPAVRANDGDNDADDHHHHHKMSASEMATYGTAAAAAIGLAGFLLLRRRNTQTR